MFEGLKRPDFILFLRKRKYFPVFLRCDISEADMNLQSSKNPELVEL